MGRRVALEDPLGEGGAPLRESGEGRGAAVPGLLEPEVEPGLSEEAAHAEDPEARSGCRGEPDENRSQNSSPPRRFRAVPGSNRLRDRQRQAERDGGKTRQSREEPEQRRGSGPPAGDRREGEEGEKQKERFRIHRDEKESGRKEKQEEEGSGSPRVSETAPALGDEQQRGRGERGKRDGETGGEGVDRERARHAGDDRRIE